MYSKSRFIILFQIIHYHAREFVPSGNFDLVHVNVIDQISDITVWSVQK